MKVKKKILKNYFIQYFLAFALSIYIKFVKLTSSIKIENENYPNEYWNNNQPFILAFWHSQLMTISYIWKSKKKISILASGHSDGRLGSMVANHLNLNNIPTSNNKKKISLRPIFKIIKSNNYIGITPDGPRGPKEKVSDGIIKIARSAKIPIIPIGFWSSKKISLNSWDSFLVTYPFSKCSFVWGEKINIPDNLDNNQINDYKIILENKINACVEKAKKNLK